MVKFLLGLGPLWPFVLVVIVLAALVSGVGVSDQFAHELLSASLLTIPAIGVSLYCLAPTWWSEDRRIAVVGLLTLPLFAAESGLALVLLGLGMYFLGFVPA